MYNRRGIEQSEDFRRRFWNPSSPGVLVSIEEHPYSLTASLAREPDLRSLRSRYQISDDVMNRVIKRGEDILVWQRADFSEVEKKIAKLQERRKELEQAIPAELLSELRGKQDSAEERAAFDREKLVREARTYARLREAYEKDYSEYCAIDREITELGFETRVMRMRAWEPELEELNDQIRKSQAVATTFRPLGLRAAAALLEHGYKSCMHQSYLLLDGFPLFSVDCPSGDDFERIANGEPRERRPYRPLTRRPEKAPETLINSSC